MTYRKGRTQIIFRPGVTLFLDTSHTDVSIQAYADWFNDNTREEKQNNSGSIGKVLIFHFASGRDIVTPLRILKELEFDLVMFCPCSDVDEDPTESFFPVTYETQLKRSQLSKKVWDDLCSDSNNQSSSSHPEDRGHPIKYNTTKASDHTKSFLVPSLRFALGLLSSEIGLRDKEGKQRPPIESIIPKMPENIRNAKRIQVMLAGGHKIVGSCLWLLGED